jgi:hypothetical protein
LTRLRPSSINRGGKDQGLAAALKTIRKLKLFREFSERQIK